ncbi:MAG: hypothetical protein MJ108_06375 [Saccharofermentans sp.]|nr:hypothetical protein [Saccharofermentans sp.]
MKKSLINAVALSVSATMLLGIAGCSKKDAKDSDSKSKRTKTEETEDVKETEESVVETSEETEPTTTEPTYDIIDPDEQASAEFDEEQMKIIINNRSMWDYGMKGDLGTGRYAVTDLDNDGNYEVIASLAGGSLLNTDSNMYEVDPENDALVLIGAWNWNGETEDDVELDWSDSLYYWVIMDGNYVYAMHNYINLGRDGSFDKVYHVTFTEDGLTDEYKGVKRSGAVAEEDGEVSDSMGNEEDLNFFDNISFNRNLQYYDDCDCAYIEWISLDGGYDYKDTDVYDMMVFSWENFNLFASLG